MACQVDIGFLRKIGVGHSGGAEGLKNARCFSVWSMILVTFPLLFSRLMVLCDMNFLGVGSSNSFMKLLVRSVQMFL